MTDKIDAGKVELTVIDRGFSQKITLTVALNDLQTQIHEVQNENQSLRKRVEELERGN